MTKWLWKMATWLCCNMVQCFCYSDCDLAIFAMKHDNCIALKNYPCHTMICHIVSQWFHLILWQRWCHIETQWIALHCNTMIVNQCKLTVPLKSLSCNHHNTPHWHVSHSLKLNSSVYWQLLWHWHEHWLCCQHCCSVLSQMLISMFDFTLALASTVNVDTVLTVVNIVIFVGNRNISQHFHWFFCLWQYFHQHFCQHWDHHSPILVIVSFCDTNIVLTSLHSMYCFTAILMHCNQIIELHDCI